MKINGNSTSFGGNIIKVHRDLRFIGEAVYNAATEVAHDLQKLQGDYVINIKRGFSVVVDDSPSALSDLPMPAYIPFPNKEVIVSVRKQALTFGQKIAAMLGLNREAIAFTADVSKAGISDIADKALRDIARA